MTHSKLGRPLFNNDQIAKHITISLLGGYTALLAFGLCMHYMFLSNIASTSGAAENAVSYFVSIAALGLLMYIILFVFYLLVPRHRLCNYYLALYAAYVSLQTTYLSWGNSFSIWNMVDFTAPLVFAMLLVLTDIKNFKKGVLPFEWIFKRE